jgi:transposase-like protein
LFRPTFCPNPRCANADVAVASRVEPRFFNLCGSYSTRVPAHPLLRRFRCRLCRKTFSLATFSSTYRQKKPHLNARIWQCLSSGVSRRQSARVVGTTRGTVERRFVFFALQSERLHAQSLSAAAAPSSPLLLAAQFDEMESFVTDRFHPVSLPILILEGCYFIVDSRVAAIRRKGTMSEGQVKKLIEIECREGRRKNTSVPELRSMLESLRTLVHRLEKGCEAPVRIEFTTDEKLLYPKLIEEVFGGKGENATLPYRHETCSSKLRRDVRNPLFPINHTNAEHRYHVAMLIRRSWCHAKKEEGLRRHLAVYRVYRNFRRWVTNEVRVTPAMTLGLAERRLDCGELFRWNRGFTIEQLRSLGAVALGA